MRERCPVLKVEKITGIPPHRRRWRWRVRLWGNLRPFRFRRLHLYGVRRVRLFRKTPSIGRRVRECRGLRHLTSEVLGDCPVAVLREPLSAKSIVIPNLSPDVDETLRV